MISILVFLACWKRPEITEICFEGIRRLKAYDPERFRISALAVISEREMITLCTRYGIQWTWAENFPIGAKKNSGLNAAMQMDFDYMMEMGSDDLVRSDLLDIYEPFMKKAVPLMGMKRLIFYNSETGEAVDYKTDTVYGMGRMISKKVIKDKTFTVEVEACHGFITGNRTIPKGEREYFPQEKAKKLEDAGLVKITGTQTYHLWKNELNRGLDNSSNYFLMSKGIPLRHIETPEAMGLDIKSRNNIWPYPGRKVGTPFDIDDFMKHCSEAERAGLIRLLKKQKIEFA